jgi:transcriptional regulator with XRE-family HTH domain
MRALTFKLDEYVYLKNMPRNDTTKAPESIDLAQVGLRLGSFVRQRRERRTIPEVAEEIGISQSALCRIELGGMPNLSTFIKVCVWLRIDPSEILGISFRRCEADSEEEKMLRVSAVHLLAGQALPEPAAHDLAQLIIFAHRELARRIREGSADGSTDL